MRFLHCSDIHIKGHYPLRDVLRLGWRRWPALAELYLRGRSEYFASSSSTVRTIAEDASRHRADHLIVSGDVTAYALEPEFDGAREALGAWADDPRRCTVVPGNHDTYTPRAVRSQRFERRFGHLLDSDLPGYAAEGPFPVVRLFDEAAVVGLRSARVPFVPGASFGWVGRAQLASLARLVEAPELRDKAVLVVVHHAPLRQDGRPDKPHHGLRDADALLRLLPGPRFAVLHGHIHHRYHHEATATRPHLFGAGSSTCRGREGYWLIEAAKGRIASFSQHLPGQ